jgi:hypothetical protein
MVFREYCLTADALYLGERPKGEIFKPCIRTIPFSQITGALNSRFARTDFKAVGFLIEQPEANRDCYLTYSPRERVADHSKVPLQVHFLINVVGAVFIVENEASQKLDKEFDILMGGMRSRGFGRCKLTYCRDIDDREIVQGKLKTRLPVSELTTFSIIAIVMPRYGYLWQPEPKTMTGCYVKSLFEDSIIKGPDFLTN